MNLQQLFQIELPVIQAPMAGVQGAALAVAVSNAGGLGSLPCAMLSLDTMRAELQVITAQTARPYNVNFFCHTPPAQGTPEAAAREAAWRASLSGYYAEFGIDPAAIPAGAGRNPFSAEAAEVLAAFRPPVVSFHFGLPPPELLARVRGWGARVISSATTVDEARWLEAQGVDAIIAQGLEAGGHRGNFLCADPVAELDNQLGTFALLPQVVRAVRVPVIAAGGIADAAGVAAALALGAAGVQVGTAYLLCPEATTSAVHRAVLRAARDEALQGPTEGAMEGVTEGPTRRLTKGPTQGPPGAAASRHTALTNLFTGRPARGFMNRLMREHGPLSALAPAFPMATAAMAPLRAKAEAQGNGDFSPLWSGQNPSGCLEIGAAELTRRLFLA